MFTLSRLFSVALIGLLALSALGGFPSRPGPSRSGAASRGAWVQHHPGPAHRPIRPCKNALVSLDDDDDDEQPRVAHTLALETRRHGGEEPARHPVPGAARPILPSSDHPRHLTLCVLLI